MSDEFTGTATAIIAACNFFGTVGVYLEVIVLIWL